MLIFILCIRRVINLLGVNSKVEIKLAKQREKDGHLNITFSLTIKGEKNNEFLKEKKCVSFFGEVGSTISLFDVSILYR